MSKKLDHNDIFWTKDIWSIFFLTFILESQWLHHHTPGLSYLYHHNPIFIWSPIQVESNRDILLLIKLHKSTPGLFCQPTYQWTSPWINSASNTPLVLPQICSFINLFQTSLAKITVTSVNQHTLPSLTMNEPHQQYHTASLIYPRPLSWH